MRSFIITCILFCVLISLIAINTIYIGNTVEYIYRCIDEEYFYTDPEKAINELECFWDDNLPIMGLSVSYRELDRMEELIVDLKTYYYLNDEAALFRTRMQINETAYEILRLEQFNVENLF